MAMSVLKEYNTEGVSMISKDTISFKIKTVLCSSIYLLLSSIPHCYISRCSHQMQQEASPHLLLLSKD